MKNTLCKLLASLFVMGAVVGISTPAQAYWTNGFNFTGYGCCCPSYHRVVYKCGCGYHHKKWMRSHYRSHVRHTCTSCGM